MSGSAMSLVLFWTAFGLISYTYMVFPVLLAALARISGSRMTESPGCARDIDLPHLTMIVAAHNEEGVLAAKLANTWQIDYPRAKFEILIGSDGSDDETVSILKSITDQRLRFFAFADRRGKISVLNDLLKAADSDIVVMSDANTMFAPDALRKLVGHFGDDRVGCVSGELSLEQAGGVSGEGLYWKYEGWIKHNESRLGFLIGCNGGIFALRRALYDPLPASTIIEDFVLTLRVIEKGYQVRFERAARAVEPACESSRAEMTRKIRIGAGGWQALGLTRAVLHPHYGAAAFAFWGHKVLRWLIPHFYLVGLAANFGLLHVPFYSVCLAVQACAALVALYAYCARGRSLPRFLRPVSYFYLMNYALGVGFLRFVFRTQRVTWERGVRNSELAAIEPGPTVESKDTSTFAARGEIPSR
jgi:cellulose synthase/poly-beta-1,6-N-acetylglucosamine synthase-like glycosyltransferase